MVTIEVRVAVLVWLLAGIVVVIISNFNFNVSGTDSVDDSGRKCNLPEFVIEATIAVFFAIKVTKT